MKFFKQIDKPAMPPRQPTWWHYCIGIVLGGMLNTTSFAAEFSTLSLRVVDHTTNMPLSNVVLRLKPKTSTPISPISLNYTQSFTLAHADPNNLPVLISYPDQKIQFFMEDRERHHVHGMAQNNTYQFHIETAPNTPNTASPKTISIPKPQVLSLHCDHHINQAFGWLYISDTPWIAQTNANGEAFFNLPVGDYTLASWHADAPHGYHLSNSLIIVTPNDPQNNTANTLLLTAAKHGPALPTPPPAPKITFVPAPNNTTEVAADENIQEPRRRRHRR